MAAALEESARLEEERRAPDEQVSSSSAAERPPSVEDEEPPADFICPITTEVLSDPVTAADGHSYERSAIERWLATKSTSPLTGEELGFTRLFPNHHTPPDDPTVARSRSRLTRLWRAGALKSLVKSQIVVVT